MIYLDNAATTEVSKELKNVIDRYLYNNYGNAGSQHNFGRESRRAVEEARVKIAQALHTVPENIIFTSSGSEANTLAIVGLSNYLSNSHLKHIITTKYEHHSVLNAMKEMERRGFEVTYLDVKNGLVSYEDFMSSVRNDTGLVSIMYMNNELGTRNNVRDIYNFCKNHEILFHCDCVQAIGTEPIDMDITADIISISGHKIHAPKGVGCLCIKYKNLLSNIIFGGEQEYGIRPGTENVAAIAAFGEAVSIAVAKRDKNLDKIYQLSSRFGAKLFQLCSKENISVETNISNPANSPKICSLRFKDIDADTLVIMLGNNDVCVSSGSACSSHSALPSHVLKAIGLTDEQARSTIRVSFSDFNTFDDIDQAVKIIVNCIKSLKELK